MKKFLTKKYIFWAGVGVVLIAIGAAVFGNGHDGNEVVTVERRDVIQEVVVTGKTKAKNEVELGFDASGRVARSYAEVGSRVARGQIIAELDVSEITANLAKEKARLAEEEVKLGSEGEKTESAIREAYSASDNAIRNKTDQFFKTPRTNPTFEVKFTDGNFVHYFNVPIEIAMELNNKRLSMESLLLKWRDELNQLNTDSSKNFSQIALQRMNEVSDFLDKVAYAINSFTPADFTYNSTVEGYKTDINLARTGVVTARSSVIGADSAGQAKVAQIKSSITALEASFSKSRIIAPFSGIITRQDAKLGQSVTAGEALISLISENEMFVEANVSEINIGKVALNNSAKIEFDAFPGETFEGKVVFIDPGETIVDKVVNYKIRIEFDRAGREVKNGLTANIKIATDIKKNVLSVPVYALETEGEKSFANKLIRDSTERVEVVLGLRGSDGTVEVVEGLAEGDRILILSK